MPGFVFILCKRQNRVKTIAKLSIEAQWLEQLWNGSWFWGNEVEVCGCFTWVSNLCITRRYFHEHDLTIGSEGNGKGRINLIG